jgi:hypothetical protein
VTLLANPAGSVFGFTMIELGVANVVPLIFSLASESGGALGSNISFTHLSLQTRTCFRFIVEQPARIDGIIDFAEFSEIHTTLSHSLPLYFQVFQYGFLRAFLKGASAIAKQERSCLRTYPKTLPA